MNTIVLNASYESDEQITTAILKDEADKNRVYRHETSDQSIVGLNCAQAINLAQWLVDTQQQALMLLVSIGELPQGFKPRVDMPYVEVDGSVQLTVGNVMAVALSIGLEMTPETENDRLTQMSINVLRS